MICIVVLDGLGLLQRCSFYLLNRGKPLSLYGSILETEKSSRRGNPANTMVEAWLRYCFWPNNHGRTTMSEKVHYRDAKAVNYFPQIRAFSSYYFTQTTYNFKVIFLMDRTTFWQKLIIRHYNRRKQWTFTFVLIWRALFGLCSFSPIIGLWFHNRIPMFLYQL